MNILITICARGGSKGIPGKNIKLLNDIPLIAYSIKIAKQFAINKNCTIALSTDDLAIKKVASNYGLISDYKRPKKLASDKAGKVETIRDILLYYEKKCNQVFDYILDLDVTSPLRTLDDLENSFQKLQQDKKAINLFSVSNANRNPYFNMVELKRNNYYNLVKKNGDFLSRQNSPKVFDLNASFYFYKRIFFTIDLPTVFTSSSLIYLVPHLCFDLDHEIDFEFLDFLIKNNKLEIQI